MKPLHSSTLWKAAQTLISVIFLLFSLAQPGSAQAQMDSGHGAATTRLEELESALSQAYGRSHMEWQDPESLSKLDSHLQTLVTSTLQNANVAESAIHEGITLVDENVSIDIYIVGPLETAMQQLEAQGMQILASSEAFGIVEGLLPVDGILNIASLDCVKALLPVMAFGVDAGSVTTQGDASHHGPAARNLGVNGSDVVVGVISDSINRVGTGVAGSQATHDLPDNVTVVSDGSAGSIDEGRAMSEIIYDMAPGITDMFFASGTASGAAGKATAINNLVADHVNIIADDIFYLNEPFFQDGPVSQAVDAAFNAGVAYFASAGNRARQSYEASFRENAGHTRHDFDLGTGIDETQTLFSLSNQTNRNTIQIVLQWDDPWGSATHDFNFYLYNTADSSLLASSTTNNITTGLPIETLTWSNTTGGAVTIGVAIERVSGTGASFLKYIIHSSGNNGTLAISEWNTASDTINPDAASAQGSLSVAAIDWGESGLNDPETFSSRGLKTRLFDAGGNRLASPLVRQKPQVAGADCVATTVPNFDPFCGTSAATPSMAGVATLVKSVQPELTVTQLYAILTDPLNTNDCTAAGNPDGDCGFGFVLADLAVASAFNIIDPAKDQTVFAGNFNSPAKVIVKVSKPANGLTASAFTVTVGGVNANILTLYEGTSEYVLEVLAPNQASNGAYDLVVTVNVTLRGVPRTFSFKRANAAYYASANNVDVDLVIDRSGSMYGAPMSSAIDASKQFVDFMHNGDSIGVVAFDDQIETSFPLTAIQAPTQSQPVFSDDMESGSGNWVVDAPWARTTSSAHSGSYSWTDSPGGNYANGVDVSLRSASTINVPASITTPVVAFWQKYALESGYDYGYVEVSTDSGGSWATLAGYTGTNTNWQRVEVNLSSYKGQNILIRFRLHTDSSVTYDGWYVDDVSVGQSISDTKSAAKNAIDTLYARGSTSIGGGLQRGQLQLTTLGDPAHPWAIVLLSDGWENTAPWVADVLPAIKQSKTVVHTIGLGSSADEALLMDIASQTGGTYYYAPGPDQLSEIYSTIVGEVSNRQTLLSFAGVAQQKVTDVKNVVVDSTISEATFSISWSNNASSIDLTLQKPDGSLITSVNAGSDPNVEYIAGSTYRYYRIRKPTLVAGTWQMQIKGGSFSSGASINSVLGKASIAAVTGEPYTARVTAATNLSMQASLESTNYLTTQPIKMVVTLSDAQPISGALVTVSIQAPPQAAAVNSSSWISVHGDLRPGPAAVTATSTSSSESDTTVTLFDDGLHGDGSAQDGVYANEFSNIDQPGTYTFVFHATGTSNMGEAFSRQSQLTGYITQNPNPNPFVSSITLADPNPVYTSSANFTVMFSEPVSGLDTTAPFDDFALVTSGVVNATVTGVSGSGTTYNVTVHTGSGNGTIRLDLLDHDSILDADGQPLGGSGTFNGDFDAGEVYTVVKEVTISGNTGAANVTLSYTIDGTPFTTVSDPNGNYSFIVPVGWSGTVIPFKVCTSRNPLSVCYFTPAKKTYASVMTNKSGQNYILRWVY